MGLLAWIYLAVVNTVTWWSFADDKRRAIARDRRIPERVLLQLAALGGTPGAIAAQQILRHKTRKQPFASRLWMICGVQAVVLVLLGTDPAIPAGW